MMPYDPELRERIRANLARHERLRLDADGLRHAAVASSRRRSWRAKLVRIRSRSSGS